MIDLFESTYWPYLAWLDEGNPRFQLPDIQHEHKTGYVHASALGWCPLRSILERTHTPPVIPFDAGLSRHRMAHGSRTGEIIQEAFLWKYGPDARVEDAVEIETANFKMRGRTDVLLARDNHRYVLELKNTGRLRESHVLQTMAYGLMLDTPLLYILTFDRNQINLYELEPADTHVRVIEQAVWRFDRNQIMQREVINAPVDSGWNYPDTLAWERLHEMVTWHYQYVLGERQSPLPDFLNDPNGRWCHKKASHTRKNGEKPFVITCPYWCHGDTDTLICKREDGRYIWLSEPF